MDEESRELLYGLQRQIAELVRRDDSRRKTTAKRRGKQVLRSPALDQLPGPKPTELDVARARRLLRGIR